MTQVSASICDNAITGGARSGTGVISSGKRASGKGSTGAAWVTAGVSAFAGALTSGLEVTAEAVDREIAASKPDDVLVVDAGAAGFVSCGGGSMAEGIG